MRTLLLLPAFVLSLAAQDALTTRAQGIQRMSTEALRQIQAELALCTEAGKGYAEALAGYTLATHLSGKDAKGAEAQVEQVLGLLKGRKDGESLALQAACLGLKIRFSPMSGMVLGPRASGLLQQARELAPGSPRVLLFQAIHTLHMPAFMGGGPEGAMGLLESGLKAAEAEAPSADPWAPRWGKAENLAWLAKVEAESGRTAAAKSHLDQALALDPGYAFARAVVAPKVEGK